MNANRLVLLLPGLLGCNIIDTDSIAANVSDELPTVATISWSTDLPADGHVEYGLTDAYGDSTPLDLSTTDHAQALLGLPADTTIHYRVVATVDGRTVTGDDQTFTTGSLPTTIPTIDAVADAPDALWGEYTLFPWYDTYHQRSTIFIVNRDGAVVWFTRVDGQSLSALFSDDGEAVLVLMNGTPDAPSNVLRVPLDGSAQTSVLTEGAHHDFLELPDGAGYAYISGETHDIAGEQVMGDKLMEVTLDGQTREVWSAFDNLPVVENDGWAQVPADWTHANGVAYDPASDLYLLSLYRLSDVVAIGRSDGDTHWILGDGGDFTFPNDGGFGPQHAPEWVDGQVLLFDNAYGHPESRLAQYALDTDAMTATLTWSLPSPTHDQIDVMGAGERLPGGGSVSGWGESDRVLTVEEDGTVARSLKVSEAGCIGSVEARDSLYP